MRAQRLHKIDIDPKIQSKFDIPDFALFYDGYNAPEAGIFVDENNLKVGDIVHDFYGNPAIVIYYDEEFI